MKIIVNGINKSANTISINYVLKGKIATFWSPLKPFIKPLFIYDVNIEKVPDSIAIIPFICNVLPIVFLFDYELEIDELDSEFYKAIDEYRKGYKKLAPMFDFKGKITCKKLIKNNYTGDKNCLLYSGGIDALNSLCVNDKKIDHCITLLGSDIRFKNYKAWNNLDKIIENVCTKTFNKIRHVVKTNFRTCINYLYIKIKLSKELSKIHDNFWHAFHHGISILGHVAPLAYIYKYKTIYIASSYTKNARPICASDPLTDECFKFGSTKTTHDGFEFNRPQKILNINKWLKNNKIPSIETCVCWKSGTGKNCGRCEKCIRTYLAAYAVMVNPSELGLELKRDFSEIIKIVNNAQKRSILHSFYLDIKYAAIKTYGDNIPEDLKSLINLITEKNN